MISDTRVDSKAYILYGTLCVVALMALVNCFKYKTSKAMLDNVPIARVTRFIRAVYL